MKQYTDLNKHFYRSHITFSAIPTIIEISKPLIKIGLPCFTFQRNYTEDRSHIRLTNLEKWNEYYYRHSLYQHAIFQQESRIFCSGYLLWSWFTREPFFAAAADHNIEYGITIIERHICYSNFFHFGSTRDRPITAEGLIEKLDLLYRFIGSFKQKAQALIKEAEKAKIKLPFSETKQINRNQFYENNTSMIELFNETEITRLYLGDEFDNTYLTRREMDILWLMKEGGNQTSIATQIGLSHRTLETHIKNIKEKLKCNTLFELGYILGSFNFKNKYPYRIPEKG
jgi:DNA-binding CsgD family transcriptional regulator